MAKRMIFHLPIQPLAKNNASMIRPFKMLEAFKNLGYEVDEVIGSEENRKIKINEIKLAVKSGVNYDFVYSESTTSPIIFNEPSHIPNNIFLEWSFFRFCSKNQIPVTLFYRDIYWKFPKKLNLTWWKKLLLIWGHKFEMYYFRKYISLLYLPSIEMGRYITEIPQEIIKALPPGTEPIRLASNEYSTDKLNLIYVGGVGTHYNIDALISAVSELTFVHLVVCTRKEEWVLYKNKKDLNSNIEVIHKSGEDLIEYYMSADLASILVSGDDYRSFAVPFKLFEYAGMNIPIIASESTLAGRMVKENNIGFSIENNVESIKLALAKLYKDRKLIQEMKKSVETFAKQNTWIDRANQVVDDCEKIL